MKLTVNEIFYSLQGEGARAGAPSVFIRLTGCNMSCGFCDTEFESGKTMEVEEVAEYIADLAPNCRTIVWTGGEPLLHLDAEITGYFMRNGWFQQVETSGSVPPAGGLMVDWITVSPKVAEHVLAKNFPDGVKELKYVRHKGQMGIPKPSIKADYYWLSPQSDGNQINMENLRHCVKLCMENPPWRLSVQQHKLWKVL